MKTRRVYTRRARLTQKQKDGYELDRIARAMSGEARRQIMEKCKAVEHARDLGKTIKIKLRPKDYEYP